ncbi:winged helix DNA-binding domain-containing protein [Actinoplanes sp. RD1]|uniref:winged helix DNA-binding domain-containing protein n=1 Tax=Actinoplanes sp. RD1 TaxID=3064538 RepID=UPI0027408D97|nr:winged helix DNA-binding domain-containing protein [Actinoplanes sp. RD1]
MELTAEQARAVRMRSLLLTPHVRRPDVAGVVEWFGAMQAQDMASGLWSLGVRLPGVTAAGVTEALERREAIRTWPMRGTVHLVPPRDAHWMLDLMGVRALAGAAKRRETLGLSEKTAERAVEVLGAALRGRRCTRAECLAALREGGIEVSGQLGYHLLWYASQRGVTCIAPHIGKEQTFVLLDEWVPDPATPTRDEALALIAHRYFRSHGPATRLDLARWTGLTVTDAKKGIALAGAGLTTVTVDGVEMLADPAVLDQAPAHLDDWAALPGFDEYMLGYKDRDLLLTPEQFAAVVPGGNGIFRPTLVERGRVVATWSRPAGKKIVTVKPFADLDRARAEAALRPYAHFVGSPLQVAFE